MFVGVLELDVLLHDVPSLKVKRAVLRPVLARLRRHEVSVAEGGEPDLHRRALLGVAVMSASAGQVGQVLDLCERQVAGEVELDLLSARRRVYGSEDD